MQDEEVYVHYQPDWKTRGVAECRDEVVVHCVHCQSGVKRACSKATRPGAGEGRERDTCMTIKLK